MAARIPALVGCLRVGGAEKAKLGAGGGSQYLSEWGGICAAPLLSAARLDAVDAILLAVVDDHAATGGDDVAVPVHLVAIGELGDEPLGTCGENDGCFVGAAALRPTWRISAKGP